jgi:membrane protein
MPVNAWRGPLRFVLAVAQRFREDRSAQTAGALTYTTLLSLVPLLTVALALSTAFPVFDRMVALLQDYALANLLPDAEGLEGIAAQLDEFIGRAAQLTAIGVAILSVIALLLMLTIDDTLNRIFRVQRRRPFAQRLAMYVAVLALGPALVGASVSMTSVLVVDSLGALNLDSLAESVLRLLPFAFTCAALTLLYLVVPNRRVALRHAFAGALLAGVAFEFAKRGFALFVTKVPTYAMIYGTFATMLFFLIWLYLSWLLVLVGATMTAMLPEYAERRLDEGAAK